MTGKTAVKLAGLTAFGYLCLGAGVVLATDRSYRRAARLKSWRGVTLVQGWVAR